MAAPGGPVGAPGAAEAGSDAVERAHAAWDEVLSDHLDNA